MFIEYFSSKKKPYKNVRLKVFKKELSGVIF